MTVEQHQTAVTASLYDYWRETFPWDVVTVFPGMRVDTTELSEWLELWIESWSQKRQRASGKQWTTFTLTVHCFVKRSSDKGRIHQLADATRNCLSRQTIPLKDFESSGHPTWGYATLFETDSRDMTRGYMSLGESELQHLIVTCRGTAQEL